LKLKGKGVFHTGTFFCDNTTAQSFPRTPIDMMFAAVMALKAYSIIPRFISSVNGEFIKGDAETRSGWLLGEGVALS
jgi:hypothetical protein